MPAALGILAPFMRDDLGVSRAQIGGLITTATIGAAAISPITGTVTDLLGGRRSAEVLFITAAVGFLGVATAPSYWWMLLPVAVAAIAQAGGNPITNKLIALHAAPGRRGVVTGVKQSGVQLGVFLGGVLMPFAAHAWGWRTAIALVVAVPAAGLVMTVIALPPDRPAKRRRRSEDEGGLPPSIAYLTVYGALMGFGAAYTLLVPLFAEEALGLSDQVAGLAIGVIGFVALFSRIAWSRHADVRRRHDATLVVLAVGAVGAASVLLLSQYGNTWLLWVGAALTGATSSSWNSVGMLATIEHAGHERSGRASGVVMLGFLAGLGTAPTLFGWIVDRTGSYTPMWLISIGALGAAAVLSVWWLRRTTSAQR